MSKLRVDVDIVLGLVVAALMGWFLWFYHTTTTGCGEESAHLLRCLGQLTN
jgi:hypothetical protein